MHTKDMTTTEYGIFNPEGCIDRSYWTPEDAEAQAAAMRADDDNGDPDAYAAMMCTEHDEQPADACEECNTDEDEDDDEDDE